MYQQDIQNKLQLEINRVFRREISIFSTVDHVYSSPPLRIIDSHHRLLKLENLAILLWDFNLPNRSKYRQELIIDSCIFSSKWQQFWLFEDKVRYSHSTAMQPDLELQQKLLKEVLFRYFDSEDIFLERFQEIKLLINSLEKKRLSSDYYRIYLASIYRSLGLDRPAQLIEEKMTSFFYSNIIQELIPLCISLTERTPYSLGKLISDGVLKPPYFRDVTLDDAYLNYGDTDKIQSDLASGSIIPSKEVIFWFFAMAGISHYGNDYGTFRLLDSYYGNSNIRNLQLTKHKQDGNDFIVVEPIQTYTISHWQGSRAKFRPADAHSSSIQNVWNAYMHMGRDGLVNAWQEYIATGRIRVRAK